MRKVVEPPLRLRWEVSEETLAAVASLADRKLAKMDEETHRQLVASLADFTNLSGTDREGLAVKLAPLFARFGLSRSQENAVWDALAVRDPEAPIITDRRGDPLPDPELRDHENVPLPDVPVAYETDVTSRFCTPEYHAAVRDYMESEVLPYVPDASDAYPPKDLKERNLPR